MHINYTLQQIATIVKGELHLNNIDSSSAITNVFTDSREPFYNTSMFIAIQGLRFDGHTFISSLLQEGCRFFLVHKNYSIPSQLKHSAAFLFVEDTLIAFQKLAHFHRSQFHYPVIGITGSNGKTTIKEWLYQLLLPNYTIVKSPKSYNSQVGVPLSTLNMNQFHTLGIFEAGISQPNEMQNLERIIQPTIGIFSSIGDAHHEGFSSLEEKMQQKVQLFRHSKVIIVQKNALTHQFIKKVYPQKPLFSWEVHNNQFHYKDFIISLPPQLNEFEKINLCHCIATMLYLRISVQDIQQRILALAITNHRLQISQAKNNITLVNDFYSNDFAGLEIALQYAHQQSAGEPFSAIISSIPQAGRSHTAMIEKLLSITQLYPIHHLFLVGDEFQLHKTVHNIHYCSSVEELTQVYEQLQLKDEVVLIKANRTSSLNQFVASLQKKLHDTVWEINLSSFENNIKVFRELLEPNVKIMVMVKAFAYGSSPKELAKLLQHQRIDYLGVAYPNEGKELREFGITTPILVMNTSELTFETAVSAQLDVEVYSIEHLTSFIQYLRSIGEKNYPIHIKLDTGMHRLGFEPEEIDSLLPLLSAPEISIRGIFSHLATSDDTNSAFATQQEQLFQTLVKEILPYCKGKPILHLLNSNGVANTNLPQYDMVRLGIGAYGITANQVLQKQLTQIGTLTATISQIKEVKPGESVGYSRAFIAQQPTKIGIITIGYADGYDRRFGNGIGKVRIKDKLVPTVGNICMDMTMIDLTNVEQVKVGDEVIITSPDLPIEQLATSIGTISYELLTNISSRVPRVFVTH